MSTEQVLFINNSCIYVKGANIIDQKRERNDNEYNLRETERTQREETRRRQNRR